MLNYQIKKMIFPLIVCAIFIALPSTSSAGDEKDPRQSPAAIGDGGAIATEHPESSEAATTILKKGGNAVDAAIAAAAVQGVTRPYSGGIGGGGIMNIYLEQEDRFVILDHRVESSENFGSDAYLDTDTDLIHPESTRISSGMATAIPGAVKAWEKALNEYGTMSLNEVLEPAIKVAEYGFSADDNFIRETSENAERFSMFKSTKEIYLDKDGNVPKPGTIMKNPDLAKTYRLIAEYGSSVFYEGEIAKSIIDTIHNPPVIEGPSKNVLPGNMTFDDLNDYEVITNEPTHSTYRGYDIYSSPPSSSGGTTIGEIFNIMEPFNVKDLSKKQALHYFMESSRYAFADRREYLGDPKHTTNPVNGLLSKGYASERRQNIADDIATVGQVAPGNPWPYEEDPDKQPEPPKDNKHAFYYDFKGDNDNPWDKNKFGRIDTGPRSSPDDTSFSLEDNTGKVEINKRKDGRGSAYGRATPNMSAIEDSELIIRFRFNELGNDQRARLWLNGDVWESGSTMPANGYGVELNAKTNKLQLRGRSAGKSNIFSEIDTDLSNDWYSLRFRTQGDQLLVRIWDDKMDEPSEWDIVHEIDESERTENPLGKFLFSMINFDHDNGNSFYIDEIVVNDLSNKAPDSAELTEPENTEDESTIHLSVSDNDGNIVSYTTTIVSIGGNGMVVSDYGFLLNNALYGRTPYQSTEHPNYPKPNYRSLSSMSPTIVMKDSKPIMTVGAPGSDTIITTVAQIIMNKLDFDMTLSEAIAEPRMTQRNNIDGKAQYEQIFIEEYEATIKELKAMGHTFKADKRIQGIGAATGLEFLLDGQIRAAVEPIRRGGGSAMAINTDEIEEPEEANKKELKKLIDTINNQDLKESDYTNESWQALSEALESAKLVLEDEDATQLKVNDALKALDSAYTGLVESDEPSEPVTAKILSDQVEHYIDEGAFSEQKDSRQLIMHLSAVGQLEQSENVDKVIKHMKSFKLILDQQKNNEVITNEAYNDLIEHADALIEKWEAH